MRTTRLSILRSKIAANDTASKPPSPTPAPTNKSGVGLSNTHTPDVLPDELKRSKRNRRSTSRGVLWEESRSRSRTRSERSRRTRSCNASRDYNTSEVSRGRTATTCQLGQPSQDPGGDFDQYANDSDGAETDVDEDQPSNQATISAPHKSSRLIPRAAGLLDENTALPPVPQPGHSDRTHSGKAPTMDVTQGEASIVCLPAEPLRIGSAGWHQSELEGLTQPTPKKGVKRPTSGLVLQTPKRPRLAQGSGTAELQPTRREHSQITNDTATQPESDEEIGNLQAQSTSTPSQTTTNTTEPEPLALTYPSFGNPVQRVAASSSRSLGGDVSATHLEHSHLDGDDVPVDPDHSSGAVIPSDDQAILGLTPSSPSLGDSPTQHGSPSQSDTLTRLRAKIEAIRSARTGATHTYSGQRSFADSQANLVGPSRQRSPAPLVSTRSSTHTRAIQVPRVQARASGGPAGTREHSVGVRIHGAARHTGRIHLGQPARPMHELLPDNEEELSHTEAVIFGARPDARRKSKPCVGDYFGTERHALTLAKIHLYAVALVEDIYMTRGMAMHTSSVVHEDTWLADLSGTKYKPATRAQCEVLVNSLSTNRGKSRDLVRSSIESGYGFLRAVDTEEDFEWNKDLYELIKDSFYCASFDPPEGYYESQAIHRAIGAGLFNGPNSVGVLYQDYFNPMPLTVAAFIIALMEFCVEEWSSGYFKQADLDTKHMSETYQFHLSELEVLKEIDSDLVERLQKEWYEYGIKYSCASSSKRSRHSKSRRQSRRNEFRSKSIATTTDRSARAKGKGRALM